MKTALVALVAAAGTANALVAHPPVARDVQLSAHTRAAPTDPDGYAPDKVACPASKPSIRAANSLSPQESSWLKARRPKTVSAMKDLLSRLNITGFDTNSYIAKHSSNYSALPNIGIAASGGGYRALMNGAGAIAAFDSRTPGSTGSGQLGGLLQSATYLSGLSGGGWLVGSLFLNNFTAVQDIIDANGQLWDFSSSVFDGPSSESSLTYYKDLIEQVKQKSDAGYKVSITDVWGRALSYQLINATDGGLSYTFSSIQNDTLFSSGETPMPLLVADGRAPGEMAIPVGTNLFEIGPWEMGSWDGSIHGFVPLQYVGSNFSNGALIDSSSCVVGVDNAGFVMGTSSSLFNQVLVQLNQGSLGIPGFAVDLIQGLIGPIDQNDDDIANWEANPFYKYNTGTNKYATQDDLTLVDGGENLENIPLNPQLQPERAVDVIFAIDSSADTVAPGYANWPNGTALVATYQRSQLSHLMDNVPFPAIPDQQTFVNLGLNSRPTFFGCDQTNYTSPAASGSSTTDAHPGPLIVYLPNAPYNFLSNYSTFDLSYNASARDATIGNGYAVATMGNGTVDAHWPTCVGCAILQRSLIRNGESIPSVCKQCFQSYCWNGTLDTTNTTYEPTYKIKKVTKAGGGSTGAGSDASALWSQPRFMAGLALSIVTAVFVGL